MSFQGTIKSNPRLKRIVHRMIFPRGIAKPRLWVRLLVNPFYHKRGNGSIIRSRTRLDVVPFNRFELGARSIIEDFSTVNNGVGDVLIGDNSLIGTGNTLIGPLTIGKNVILAQNIVASGLNHEYRDPAAPISLQNVTTSPILIEDDCWVGANVVITAGVTIGKHSVIAAGSVLTRDVPPFSVAAGNPARVVKRFDPQQGLWIRATD